ncbi:MAG: hypothetical protein ACRDBO_05685 [Lachnospiraceae bacterium]
MEMILVGGLSLIILFAVVVAVASSVSAVSAAAILEMDEDNE